MSPVRAHCARPAPHFFPIPFALSSAVTNMLAHLEAALRASAELLTLLDIVKRPVLRAAYRSPTLAMTSDPCDDLARLGIGELGDQRHFTGRHGVGARSAGGRHVR